jgi:selenocysteine lyase/cysteine desulfurase
MAMTRGRTELADSIQTRVNALAKDFRDQIGAAESAEYNALFSTAAKQITSQVVQGITAQDVQTETQGETVSVYALMVQSPKAIKEYFSSVKNTPAHLYDRFRASQAFTKLDQDVQRFEEFLRQEAQQAGGGRP